MSDDRRQTETSDIRHLKTELRRLMETRRAEAARDKQAPLALRDHFLQNITLPPGGIVASYCARGNEMDPAALTAALRAMGHPIALPVMAGRGESLIFRLHTPGTPLRLNPLGIGEPDENAPIVEPDILLVPLLAFDCLGGRLGAGGGYYDRTLRELRAKKPILAIGIGFSCQEVPAVPLEPQDEKLGRIATESGTF